MYQVVDGFFVKRVQDVRESAAYLTIMTRHLTRLYQVKRHFVSFRVQKFCLFTYPHRLKPVGLVNASVDVDLMRPRYPFSLTQRRAADSPSDLFFQNRTLTCRSRELEGDEASDEAETGNPSCSLISFAEFNHGALKNKVCVQYAFIHQLWPQ